MNFWLPTPMAPVLHQVTFSVRLRPKGWTRASPFLKGGRLIVSKNQGDRDWQAYFREEFIRKMSHQQLLGLFPWSGPVIMQNFFLYLPPKNWWPGKEKVTTPDDDNLAKQVADALSPKAKGGFGAYEDDRQIIARTTMKLYHTKGDAVITSLYLLETVDKPRKRKNGPSKT